MDARTPHYLRFARTLALATTLALPACADVDGAAAADEEATPAGEATTSPAPTAFASPAPARTVALMATPAPTPTPVDEMDGGAGGQSYGPKSSGPLPPPEMPASLA